MSLADQVRGKGRKTTAVETLMTSRRSEALWNTNRAQAPGSATHAANPTARYPETAPSSSHLVVCRKRTSMPPALLRQKKHARACKDTPTEMSLAFVRAGRQGRGGWALEKLEAEESEKSKLEGLWPSRLRDE